MVLFRPFRPLHVFLMHKPARSPWACLAQVDGIMLTSGRTGYNREPRQQS